MQWSDLTVLIVSADWCKWTAEFWEESSTAALSTAKCINASKQWHATSLYSCSHARNVYNTLMCLLMSGPIEHHNGGNFLVCIFHSLLFKHLCSLQLCLFSVEDLHY